MIKEGEIKRKARGNSVPASTIERDYAQSWFLKNFAEKSMLLKGGTGIKKVYFEDYRFSDDLDFSMIENLDKEKLQILTKRSIEKTERESGIRFEEDFEIEKNQNGHTIGVYFRILRASGSPLKIKVDMTHPGKEKIVLPPELKKILHRYSDQFDKKVRCYPLEEILAEKIRALFERTRPRDLYDIWKLYERVDGETKCKFKNIERDPNVLMERKEDYRHSWENSLKHQMERVPEFETVFGELMSKKIWEI